VALVPVVDGEFITQRASLALAHGKVDGVGFSTFIIATAEAIIIGVQEALLSFTNTFEGTIFVDQTTVATANATEFALDIYPNFNATQANEVGALYAPLRTQLFQSNAIYGDCSLRFPFLRGALTFV
jgi:hypothetical protein